MTLSMLLPGLLLLIACIAYVFWPRRTIAPPTEKTRLDYLHERRDVLYDNLRDLNFEYKAGKHPEDDFLRQRAMLESETAAVLREIDARSARS